MKSETEHAQQNKGTDINPTFVSTENRHWMVVDDNPDILMMLSAVLENFTTATIECHDSPQSALSAYAASPDAYELVMTDFEMPGMDGAELARQLRAISPSQKIFLVTGNGFWNETAARQYGFTALLKKPFPLMALRRALAAAALENECPCAI